MEEENWQAREEREKREIAIFRTTIEKVALIMGWTLEEGQNGKDTCRLSRNHDVRIWARYDYWDSRIEFSSLYPHGDQGWQPTSKHFNITVALNKDPSKIVKDIKNRLLPDYLPELERVKKQIDETRQYLNNKTACIQKIADHLGIEKHNNGALYPNIPEVYSIHEYSEDKVKFEVKCSPEKAIRILALLKN